MFLSLGSTSRKGGGSPGPSTTPPIQVNFLNISSHGGANPTPANWNEMGRFIADGDIADLIDENGAVTGYSLFHLDDASGQRNNGKTGTDGTGTVWLPADVAITALETGATEVRYRFEGASNTSYVLKFYGSYTGSNPRGTIYKAWGTVEGEIEVNKSTNSVTTRDTFNEEEYAGEITISTNSSGELWFSFVQDTLNGASGLLNAVIIEEQ